MSRIITNSGTESLLKIFEYYQRRGYVVFAPEYGCSDIYSALYSSNVNFYLYPIESNYLLGINVLERILGFQGKVVLLVVHHHGRLGYDKNVKTVLEEGDIDVVEDCALCNYSQVCRSNLLLARSSKIFSFGTGKAFTFSGGGLLVTSKDVVSEKFRFDPLFFLRFFAVVLVRSNKKLFSFFRSRVATGESTTINLVECRRVSVFFYLFIWSYLKLSRYYEFRTNRCVDFEKNYYEPLNNFCHDYLERIYFDTNDYLFLRRE